MPDCAARYTFSSYAIHLCFSANFIYFNLPQSTIIGCIILMVPFVQQLKEVLAKQAELGVEVAEVPPSYLHEPEELVPKKENEREATDWPSSNRFNKKRGRVRDRDNWRFKRQKFNNKGAPTSPPSVKREPSLLEKLLSSDVKRGKSQLLQIFRFMVLNDFFKQLPGKPLEFPVITVTDDGCGSEIVRDADPSLEGLDSPADEATEKALAEGIDSQKESCVAEEMENESDEEDTVGFGEQFEESEEGGITD